MRYRAYDIKYETGRQKARLPKEICFEVNFDPRQGLAATKDMLADLIGDKTGWPVNDFKFGIVQVEREVRIAYRWWRPGKKLVKPEHVEALEEAAMDRIREQMAEGCTSGELNDNIRMTDDDPEDGVEYSGHWEVQKT